MANAAVSNPRTTLNIVTRDQRIGPADQRAIIYGQKTAAGIAAAGLYVDVPRTEAEINTLFGADSHLALVARRFRKVNGITNLDAMVFADAGGAVKATSVATFAGTATGNCRVTLSIVSKTDYAFDIDVVTGDTAAAIAAKALAVINEQTIKPFTAAVAVGALTATAANGGTVPNDWLIAIDGQVPGITVTLTGWTGGATDPSLTTAFDEIDAIRYQTIVWPSTWTRTGLGNFLNARKNVDNDVMEGRAFLWHGGNFATVKADALTSDCSEIVFLTNEKNTAATWKGPHLPEAPDCLAATFAAARARRFETGFSISNIVSTNESADQFGGIHTASLPYFNTPMLYTGLPQRGSGYIDAEQMELRDAGVSVIGANRSFSGVVTGQVVTNWQFDAAGNPDDTWKYLEWRDTHGVIREYVVVNVRKEFAQYRLTTGVAVANYAIADEETIRAYVLSLTDDLAGQALVVAGHAARTFIEREMIVNIKAELRTVEIYLRVPMVSQMAQIIGTVKFQFNTA